jgi:hypothetical protein
LAVGALVKQNAVAMRAAATIGNRRERFVWVMAVFIIGCSHFTKAGIFKANKLGRFFALKWLQSHGNYVTSVTKFA